MDIGTGPLVVVGGFSPDGLNVNNNNYDNDDSGTKAERESGESVPTATADETARCGCNWCGSRWPSVGG